MPLIPPLPQNSFFVSPYSLWETMALGWRYKFPDQGVASIKPRQWTRREPTVEKAACSVFYLGDLMVGPTIHVGPRLMATLRDDSINKVVINLETPIVPNPQAPISYWQQMRHSMSQSLLSFAATPDYLEQLVGFLDKDKVVWNLANNHSNDRSIETTEKTLREAGYKNLLGLTTTLLVVASDWGINIGIRGGTLLANWGAYYGVCLGNDIINEANEAGGDFTRIKKNLNVGSITGFYHWGEEYSAQPSARTEDSAKLFVRIGDDAVVGHGPHVIQRLDILRDTKRGVDVPVAYSLGNFVSRRPNEQNSRGLAQRIDYDADGLVMGIHQFLIRTKDAIVELEEDPT